MALGRNSEARLYGVHPQLVNVVRRAADMEGPSIIVVEGLRSLELQRKYVAAGRSLTLASRHLLQPSGFGEAVDLCVWKDKRACWEFDVLVALKGRVFAAAVELNVSLTWGGEWKRLVDTPHYQLRRT